MNIYVYWNRNDNDCTKIFHCMSPNDEDSVVECLKEGNLLDIDRIYQPFSDDAPILEAIKKNDMIIFMTHGTEDSILKYRNKPDRELEEYILLDKSNAKVLRDKIVLAFCCSSAKVFGRYCVGPETGCRAYVGFEEGLVYDNGKALKSRHLIYESYKKAFMKSLRYAVKHKCTIEEYRIKLAQFMRKEAANAIFLSNNNTLHNMYSGTIEGLVALGNVGMKMFGEL